MLVLLNVTQFLHPLTHQVENKVTPTIQGYVSGVDVIRAVPIEQDVISVVQRTAAYVFSSKLNVCVPDDSFSFSIRTKTFLTISIFIYFW